MGLDPRGLAGDLKQLRRDAAAAQGPFDLAGADGVGSDAGDGGGGVGDAGAAEAEAEGEAGGLADPGAGLVGRLDEDRAGLGEVDRAVVEGALLDGDQAAAGEFELGRGDDQRGDQGAGRSPASNFRRLVSGVRSA